MTRKQITTRLLAGALIASAAGANAQDTVEKAVARLVDREGAEAGMVDFTASLGGGVLVNVFVTSGLTPGEHAVHLHEIGACKPDFSAANGHLNPTGREHGYLAENGPHAGDLPNIFAGLDGAAHAHFFAAAVSLDGDDDALLDEDGSAIIVHARADTYQTDTGGDRVLCGVLEPLL